MDFLPYEIIHKILLTSCMLEFENEIKKRGDYDQKFVKTITVDDFSFDYYKPNVKLRKAEMNTKNGVEIIKHNIYYEDLKLALIVNKVKGRSKCKTKQQMISVLQKL